MRVPALPIVASLVLFAVPALAQTSNPTGGQLSDTSTSSRIPPDTAVTLDTQQKLKQSLQQSDFKKVVVVPEAYIHAQAPDGSKIVMEVSPHQMQAVIERVTAIEILVRLKDTHPDGFTDKQEQTLQRAVEDLYTREY